MITILAKKVRELEKTQKESSSKIKTLERKNNVQTEKLSKINDEKNMGYLHKQPSGNCKSSRNEKFEKLINNLDKNYHSFKESTEKNSNVTEDDNSFYHQMLSNKMDRDYYKEEQMNTQEDQVQIERITTNSSADRQNQFQKDKKKKKKKFIDIEKFGIINNDKYLALKEKNKFIDKDKLKQWEQGTSKDLSLNTLNSIQNQKTLNNKDSKESARRRSNNNGGNNKEKKSNSKKLHM